MLLRSSRGVQPTEEGRFLLPQAETILNANDDCIFIFVSFLSVHMIGGQAPASRPEQYLTGHRDRAFFPFFAAVPLDLTAYRGK